MNQRSKILFSIILAISGIPLSCANNTNKVTIPSPYFFIRSQSRDKVHQVVGSIDHTHVHDLNRYWTNGDALMVYEQSFNSQHIADALFGCNMTSTIVNCCRDQNDDDCCLTIPVQGSQVPNRIPNAWLADYFYLPPDFTSIVAFKPQVRNFLIVLDKYIGLDPWLCGLYFRIYGPITFTKWDIGFCESSINQGTLPYPPGYFNSIPQPANSLLHSFSEYAAGVTPQAGSIAADGIVLQPLKYAKISHRSKTRSGFADLRMELGWDFLESACYYLGLNVQAAAPTGNRIRAEHAFDPQIGNGKHWEVGGGVTAFYHLWSDPSQSFGFYLDANVTHLFKTRQQRTFDLKCKPVSRYMLAERMGTLVVNLTSFTTGAVPTAQFQNEFAPVANLTTMDVEVSIGVQADVVAWVNYSRCNWSLDVGYNFWGTTHEKINFDKCRRDCKNPNALCNTNQTNSWALKGDARVIGFQTTSLLIPSYQNHAAIALSATESNATINSGTNIDAIPSFPSTVPDPYEFNAGVDNPQFAANSSGAALIFESGTISPVFTSVEPILLSCSDINFIRNQGMTHKVFVHANYTFDCPCFAPYVGLGGSAEFSQNSRSNPACSTTCTTKGTQCQTTGNNVRRALSMWSLWIKGGVSF